MKYSCYSSYVVCILESWEVEEEDDGTSMTNLPSHHPFLQGTRLLEANFINNTSMVFGLCLRVCPLFVWILSSFSSPRIDKYFVFFIFNEFKWDNNPGLALASGHVTEWNWSIWQEQMDFLEMSSNSMLVTYSEILSSILTIECYNL